MSYSKQILVGVAAGIAAGIILGDLAGSLKLAADAYLKLLQMTVLPYVVVSIIIGLGSLNLGQAKTLALRGGAVLLLLWALTLAVVFVFPLMLPPQQTASVLQHRRCSSRASRSTSSGSTSRRIPSTRWRTTSCRRSCCSARSWACR